MRRLDAHPRLLALACLLLIATGGALSLLGAGAAGDAVWAATAVLMLVPLTLVGRAHARAARRRRRRDRPGRDGRRRSRSASTWPARWSR